MTNPNTEHTLQSLIESIQPGHHNAISVARALAADKVTPITRLEFCRTIEHPQRQESPPRGHVFYDPVGFAVYLRRAVKPDRSLVVLIDDDQRQAQAILDDDARKGVEVIAFCPPHDPVFELVRNVLLTCQSVRQFADAVVRCRRWITGQNGQPADGRQLAMLMRQITVSNEVTCQNGAGNNAVNGVMIKTQIKAGQTAETPIELPDTLELTVPIFRGAAPVAMEVFLSITPKGPTETLIRCEVPDLDVIISEQFDRLVAPLETLENALVSHGRIAHGAWAYVK